MVHFLKVIPLVFFIFLTAGSCLGGEDIPHLIFSRDNGNYPPYKYEEGGQLRGVHIELILAASKRMGVEPRFTSVSWARALRFADTGVLVKEENDASFKDETWFDQLVFLHPPLNESPQYLAFSRHHPDWSERFAKAMVAVSASGERARIYRKYGVH